MSAVELAIEKVKRLDEAHARQLLDWLQTRETATPARCAPLGASAMMGFARRFRADSRSTSDWMHELREGERD
jgi:hypothetical protein